MDGDSEYWRAYMEMGDLDKAEAPRKDALRIANELKGEQFMDAPNWQPEGPASVIGHCPMRGANPFAREQ